MPVTVASLDTAGQTPVGFTVMRYVSVSLLVAGAVSDTSLVVSDKGFPFIVHAMLLLVPPITGAVKVIGLLIHSDRPSTLTVAGVSTFTVTFIVSFKLVAVFVPVIVNANVPAVVGVNVGFKVLVLLNPVAGLHEIPLYVFVFA